MSIPILCIGAAMIDRKYELHGPLVPGSSNPGRVVLSHGGVARNIAETIGRLGGQVSLAAAIGADDAGLAIRAHLEASGVDASGLIVMEGQPTAEYAAILAAGSRELALAVVAMDHAEKRIAAEIPTVLKRAQRGMRVFADANLPREALAAVLAASRSSGFALALDAVSVAKAQRLPERLEGLDLLFMNRDEAIACLGADAAPEDMARALVGRGAFRAVVTDGAAGVFAAEGGRSFHIPPSPQRWRMSPSRR